MDLLRLQSLAGITNNTPIITEELNYWQLMAGMTPELLQEAREDQIAKTQGHKLISAYQQKEQNPIITDPLELLQFISRNTIPEYIQWITTQYIKDPNFTLKDLPKLKEILVLYKPLFNRKKIQDLSKFNITSLEQAVSELSGGDLSVSYNPEMLRFYEAMLKSEKLGNGVFKYKSGNLCVYIPINIEGARELRRANPDTIQLCTTFLDKTSFYNDYSDNGIQDYILVPDNMYLFYIGITGKQPTEFGDYKNIHLDIEDIVKYPKAFDVIKPDILQGDLHLLGPLGLVSSLSSMEIIKKLNMTPLEYVSSDEIGTQFSYIPSHLLTPEFVQNLFDYVHPVIFRYCIKWLPEDIVYSMNTNDIKEWHPDDNTTEYYWQGQLHREDGPAIVRKNGNDEYWLGGTRIYNEDEYNDIISGRGNNRDREF